MALASLISLKHTIEHLQNSSEISLVPPSPEILEIAYSEAKSAADTLKKLDSSCERSSSSSSSRGKRIDALDGRIRESVRNFEVALGSHVSDQIVSRAEGPGAESHPSLFSIDLKNLKQEVHSFAEKVKKMEEEYIKELDYALPKEEQDDAISSGKKSELVGLYDEYSTLKEQLISNEYGSVVAGVQVTSVVGMPGIGKTAFVKEIFEDPRILECFDCHAWVTVGRKCQSKKIQQDILAQMNPNSKMLMEDDEKIAQQFYGSLKDRRYLIVLDDVWDTQIWHDLERLFPENSRGNQVLLTTRLQKVAQHASRSKDGIIQISLLQEEESWRLLRQKVFGKELCPQNLEKAGKKIAENCEGLPLTIITIAKLLSKAQRTPEYWNKIAADRQNSLFTDAYNEISEVLYPSYENLPQDLKVCFLYMGVFPQDYKIPPSKLIKLWTAEGFFKPHQLQTSREDYIVKCLHELSSNNVVMLHQKNTISHLISTAGIKTCRLHSSFWHLCKREARKDKFFYVLSNHADRLEDRIERKHRLCIHNNILFGIKNVYNSIEKNCASAACSLLCFGPYHQYPVPICFGLGSLNVLDALSIRFYEFPNKVLELNQLRYLALTCNGKLPNSISKLSSLQFFIVLRHSCIRQDPSHIPIEIWDMKELKHLQIMGSDLLDRCGTLLPNLLTLLDVTAHSCTKGIFERVPHLKKLGVRIELAPNFVEPMSCFDHISHLKELESLKCIVVNPEFGAEFVHAPASLSMLSSSLKRLSLSGFGYPWEYMRVIASLENLEVLKLQRNAFRGPMWVTEENTFLKLKILVIDETDLEIWKARRGSFKWLTCLSINNCYKLVELDMEFGIFLSKIELVDCNPSAMDCVERIRAAEQEIGYTVPDVYVHSSWNDGNVLKA